MLLFFCPFFFSFGFSLLLLSLLLLPSLSCRRLLPFVTFLLPPAELLFDNMRVIRFSSSSSCFSSFGSVACRRISYPSAAAAVRVFLCLLPLQLLLLLLFVFCGPAFSGSFFFIFFSFSLYLRLSLALFVYLLRSEIPVS